MGTECVKLLLDTHVWIWAFEGAEVLGTKCARALRNSANERFVSPVSTLEIARLVEGGRINLACPLKQWIETSFADLRLDTIPLDHVSAMDAYQLPPPGFHADPVDRMLVATARIHRCCLITADERILKYPQVATMDARK